MTILSSSTICGDEVVNSAGEKLGDIKELMIDCASSRVSYAVLEFGGFLGMGQNCSPCRCRQSSSIPRTSASSST